jgi:hypothetical protein
MPRPDFDIARKRVSEITALVRHRHRRLPDTDDRCIYLEMVALHLKPRDGDLAFALEQWCYRVGAVLSKEEINGTIEKVQAKSLQYRADTLGKVLRVTYAERSALRITTIGCYDVPKVERTRRRKERHRLSQQARRRAQGVIPREQYLAKSISRQQPWQAAGVSRATWYRLLKAGSRDKSVRSILSSPPGTDLSHEEAAEG